MASLTSRNNSRINNASAPNRKGLNDRKDSLPGEGWQVKSIFTTSSAIDFFNKRKNTDKVFCYYLPYLPSPPSNSLKGREI